MLKRIFLFVLPIILWGVVDSVRACSVCGCGDPLQSAAFSLPRAGNMRLSFQAEYLQASAAGDQPNQTESLKQQSMNGLLFYSPTSDLSLILEVPLVVKQWSLIGGSDPSRSANPAGLGDINIAARYFLWSAMDMSEGSAHALAVSLGAYLPTGNDNGQSDGERIDQHAQLGTGAWGPHVGLYYTMRNDDWNFTANVTGIAHTRNSFDYHFGNAVRWGVQGQYHVSDPFAVSLALEGRTITQDNDGGDAVANTGGTVVTISPGAWWNPIGNWALYAKVQIPMITNFIGQQTVGTMAMVGTQWLLQ